MVAQLPDVAGLESLQPDWARQASGQVDLQGWARSEAARLGVPAEVGTGVLQHESSLDAAAMQNPKTWGNGGGVGQFTTDTARQYGTTQEELRANPKKAVTLMMQLLKDNADMFGGDYQKGAAAYFIGAGNVQKAEKLGGGKWLSAADEIAKQYKQGTVSDYLSSALSQHLSTGTTSAPASSGGGLSMLGNAGNTGNAPSPDEQPSIEDQLAAARARRLQQQAAVFGSDQSVDPGIDNLPRALQGGSAGDPGFSRSMADQSHDTGFTSSSRGLALLGGGITPPATGDGGLGDVPAPDPGQTAAGEAGLQAPYTTLGGWGLRNFGQPGSTPEEQQAATVRNVDTILGRNPTLGSIERDTRIADIPYADYVQNFVTDQANALPAVEGYNIGAGLANQGLSMLGAPKVIPTAGDLAGGLVPTNVRDLGLTLLPEAGKVGELAQLGRNEAAVRIGASATADRLLPTGILADERRGANVVEGLGGTRTQGARVGQEFGTEVGGGTAFPNGAPSPSAAVPAATTNELPDLGDSGIQAALAAKREATLPAGRVFGEQGSLQRKIAGAVNPAVDLPEDVHVANQARVAVQSSLRTELANAEVPAYRELADTFEKTAPKYVGAADRPLANTWVDYAENPSLYRDTPELEAAKNNLRSAQDASLSKVRSEYGADVGRYQGSDPGAVYIPHQASRDSVEKAVASTEASLSSRSTISKERAYESLSDRVAKHPEFKPELDPTVLADTHASALASMAANNTFKAGVGGKTLTEVIDETHPGLRQARDDMVQAVQNVKNRIDSAEARAVTHDATLAPLIKEQGAIADRATPAVVALDEADKLTPELKQMRTQLRELKVRGTSIENAIERVSGKRAANALGLASDRQELDDLAGQLDSLRARYHSAAPGDYVMNRKTFRFHDAVTSAAIDSVTKTGFNNALIDGAIGAGNTARAAGLGPDFSPLSIQGALGAMSHPEVAIKNAATLAKVFKSDEAFRAAMDPDLVRRFEFASNRRLGSASEDVLNASKGIQLPGRPLKRFDDALQRVIDYGTLKAFENDSNLLMKLGETSQNVADHEAASSISKIVPRMDNAAQGRSVQRVKLEGALPTSRSFTAQPFSLAKDYLSGVAKVASGRPAQLLGREKLALVRGTTLVGSLLTLSVGSALLSAEANGKSPVEAVKEVIDPSSSRFMSIILGNKGSIPMGGPFRSAFLGVFRTATQGPKGAVNYARGRLMPEAGAGVDVAVNRDFKGQPIRTGSDWHQVLQSVTHIAQSANLLAGGTVQGAQEGGAAGAAEQFAAGLGGVNYTERTPYDQRDLEAREQFGKPYSQLFPQDKAKIDAQGITPQSDYQKRKAEVVTPINDAERQALDAFKAGMNEQKITDIWHDLGQRRLQAAKDLSTQFATMFNGFDKTKYETALNGLYAIDKTFADGTPDYDSTQKARDAYLAGLPADQQEWLKQAQDVTEAAKTPERQKYDQYVTARKAAGYFDIDPKDPHAGEKRAALDAANPELDLASWYYSGTKEQAGAGLNSIGAADKALAMNLPSRPVKLTGYSRPLNESPKVQEVYEGVKQLMVNYDQALANPQNLELHAQQTYQKKYADLTQSQQTSVKASISRALQTEHPQLDAVLAFFGRNEGVAGDEAVKYLTQMASHAGIDPAKDPILQKVKKPTRR